MEVEEIQSPKQPATKYSKISSNGGGVGGDGSPANAVDPTTAINSGGGGGRWGRQWGDSSRIIRVSRASGGKDRHSKVWTAKGPRDRRVRLSVTTAIQFYDLQDRLGFDQPSKAVEWLINQASDAINDLPSLDVANFPQNTPKDQVGLGSVSKPGGSSSSNNSETSKGSGLSLSRSGSRVKARERTARESEQLGPTDSWQEQQQPPQQQQQNSSFTQLLTAGISSNSTAVASSAASRGMSTEYFGNGQQFPFLIDQHHQNQNQNHSQQQFPFLIDQHQHDHHRLGQTGATTTVSGFNRGTLQSNSSSTPSMLSYLQRFSDGSSVPFFLGGAPISPVVDNQQHHHHDNHQQFNPVGLHLCYGDNKGKGKN
ncbi:uncharacterized protein LOC141592701 [Silene latifolia]|uniref:uncharacterized protein LOC141592701 n=1 Tax=Silene latifolia TaxID=37657 RepID=UPI003D77D51B